MLPTANDPPQKRLRRHLSTFFWPISLLFGLCVLTFLLSYIAPGDPARIILGPNAHEDAVRELRTQMGFNRSLSVQFGDFLLQIVTGRWGDSWISRQPVLKEIGEHLSPTASMGLLASLYSIVSAVLINALIVRFPRIGRGLVPLLRLGISLPSFVVAVAAALVATRIQSWSGGADEINGDSFLVFAVPAIAVAFYPACVMTALLRDRFTDLQGTPFFKASRATGYSRMHLFWRVLVRNSWTTLLTAWVNQISLIVFSTIIVEYVFSFRGIGTLLISAIQEKDLPVLSGIILLNGLFFILVRTISDVSFRRAFAPSSAPDLRDVQAI